MLLLFREGEGRGGGCYIADYNRSGFTGPSLQDHNITAVVDSDAQCCLCLWGYRDCVNAGIQIEDLLTVRQKLSTVSQAGMLIHGAVILRMVRFSPAREEYTCAAICVSMCLCLYVSPDVSKFYFSQDAMMQLRIITDDFPLIGGSGSCCVDTTFWMLLHILI